MREFMTDINRITQKHGFSKEEEATDPEQGLKTMIAKTKNIAQGSWFKCSKGTTLCQILKSKLIKINVYVFG